MSKLTAPLSRSHFRYFHTYATRWNDNDMYGHMNNSVYHFYADSVINKFLIERAGLQPQRSSEIGLCLSNSFRYFTPIAYPADLVAGLCVEALGNTSVTYRVGIFPADCDKSAALGQFVHVFVNSDTRVKTEIPPTIRNALTTLVVL